MKCSHRPLPYCKHVLYHLDILQSDAHPLFNLFKEIESIGLGRAFLIMDEKGAKPVLHRELDIEEVVIQEVDVVVLDAIQSRQVHERPRLFVRVDQFVVVYTEGGVVVPSHNLADHAVLLPGSLAPRLVHPVKKAPVVDRDDIDRFKNL